MLSEQVGEIPPNKDSESGDDIHHCLALKESPKTLSPENYETFSMCREDADKIFNGWIDRSDDAPRVQIIREERLYLRKGLRIAWSGKGDVIAVQGRRALIIDYKTGRKEVPATSTNRQLRTLVPCVVQTFDVDAIRVAIVQPWVTRRPEYTDYDLADIAKAAEETYSLADRAITPGQEERLNPFCDYCAGKIICRKFQALLKTDVSDLEQKMEGVPDEVLSRALQHIPLYQKLFKEVVALAKKRKLDKPDSLGDWKLTKSGLKSKIVDTRQAFVCLQNDLSVEEFNACTKVTLRDLRAAIRIKRNLTLKGSAQYIETKLGPLLEKTPKAPRLEYMGDAMLELEDSSDDESQDQ